MTSLRVDTGNGSAADDLSGRRAMPAATSANIGGGRLEVAIVDQYLFISQKRCNIGI